MNCVANAEPVFYGKGGNFGLAVEITGNGRGGRVIYDDVRAFVVMTFLYKFPKLGVLEAGDENVSQAFYRSSGSNSNEQFGDRITDKQAKGTWIPTNGLVVREGMKDNTGVCVLGNYGFILKKPFLQLGDNTILSRFHGDPQLALISYTMGGGIWEVSFKRKELGDILTKSGYGEYGNYVKSNKPGCANLTDNLIPVLSSDINRYIADSVSWNWHPLDTNFLIKSGNTNGVNLNDETLWIEKDGRYFIPRTIFLNPGVIKNYKKYSKMFGPEKAAKMSLGNVINPYNTCGWEDNAFPELYPKI